MSDSLILISREGPVGILQLNRPKQLNALSTSLIEELLGALQTLQADDAVGAIVVTGNEKAFAGPPKVLCGTAAFLGFNSLIPIRSIAGADIKEMKDQTMMAAYLTNFLQGLSDGIGSVRKPVIAAVNGFAVSTFEFHTEEKSKLLKLVA